MKETYTKGTISNRTAKIISWRRLAAIGLVAAMGWTAPATAGEVLHFYNWTDYTPLPLLKKFEKETGIKVQLDTYDSNETLLAKLKAGGGGYDIVVPSHNFVPIFIKEGLIQKVDIKNMPNYKYVDKQWRNPSWDPNQEYTAPYQMGTQSFAFRSSIYKGKGESWKEFFEPEESIRGKLVVFKDPGEIINEAHLYLGQKICSENPQDYKAIEALLKKQKPFVKLYSSETMNERLKNGVAVMSSNWDGNTKRAVYEDKVKDVIYAYPKEGVTGFFDNLTVATGAPNKAAAEKFINFIMQPENMAAISNAQGYNNAIPASKPFLTKDMQEAQSLQVPKGQKIVFPPACGEKAIQYTDKVWTSVQQ